MFAIVETGGKQYRVTEGAVLQVEKLEVTEGEEVTLDKVLVVENGGQLLVGTPYVEGALVTARVRRQGRKRKVIVFKYKPKKNYRRKKGHRQAFTELEIEAIKAPGGESGETARAAAPQQAG